MPDETKDSDSRPQLIPKVWTDPAQLERAHTFVRSQLQRVLPDHESRRQKWIEWDKVYRLIDESKPTDGGSQLVDPEPQIIVDVLKANYLEAMLSNSPNFEYKGQEDTDSDQAEIMTAYRADHLSRIKLPEKMERTLHQWLVFGTTVAKDPWRKEVTKRKVREVIYERDGDGNILVGANGKPKTRTVVKEVDFPRWDDTDWQYVSLFDIFFVGHGSDIQSLEGVIHRSKITWDDLKSNERKTTKVSDNELVQGVYYNLDAVNPRSFESFDIVEYWGKIPKWVLTGKDDDRYVTFEGLISCVLDLDTLYEQTLQSIHSERTGEVPDTDSANPVSESCVRLQENPFWHGERPFRLCPYTPVDDEIYGIGAIEPMFEKWHELNTTIRQLVDNKTLQLLNPTIEDSNANVQRDIKLIKFPRIKADDVGAVVPLPINDFSANGWRLVASIKDDMRRASGALETLQGVSMKDERVSATEFQGTFQQAGVRLKSRIRIFDDLMFRKFLERSYQNDQQFAEFERIVRVTGKKGVAFSRVRPEDIWGTFDIITYGPLSFENKVIKANKLTNFFAIAAKVPQAVNIPKLLKKIYVKMDIGPEHEADDLVISQEPESSRDIENEITALSIGQTVIAKPTQDHQLHIQRKMQAAQSLIKAGLMEESIYKVFEENVNGHISLLEKQGSAQGQQAQGAPGMNQMAQNGTEVPIPNVGATTSPNPMEQVGV